MVLWIQEFTGATKKAVKTLVVSKFNRKFAAKTIIMKSYGRKIIDYIFKRWAERPAICYELERKVQADSDRSDIRVFETGISTQQYGDNRQSTRTAEEKRYGSIFIEQNVYDSYNCKKQKSHPGSLCKWEAWWKLSLQRYAY